MSTTLSLTGGFGPSLAAVVLVAFGGGRVGLRRWMTGCLQWRAGWAWLFNRSRGSIVPVLALHTAVNAWFLIIPVMVLPDGSNLRPFQIVVGMLVMTAIALLLSSGRLAGKVLNPLRASPPIHKECQYVAFQA